MITLIVAFLWFYPQMNEFSTTDSFRLGQKKWNDDGASLGVGNFFFMAYACKRIEMTLTWATLSKTENKEI